MFRLVAGGGPANEDYAKNRNRLSECWNDWANSLKSNQLSVSCKCSGQVEAAGDTSKEVFILFRSEKTVFRQLRSGNSRLRVRQETFSVSGERRCVDFHCLRSNNPRMPRPEGVRRVKSYSAANGYVYQYCFYEGNRRIYEGKPVGEFIYAVSADRKTTFPLRIIVRQSALFAWAKSNGRPLTSSEEYAVAKMRLLQAFDEGSVPLFAEAAKDVCLLVDESNLETLLQQLYI